MANSLPTVSRRTEVKPVELPLIGEARRSQAPVKPVDADWILPVLGRAIDRSMQRKEAAILMGIDAGQMTRQLSGEGHLSALRLGALPETFWVAVIDELRDHFGLNDPAERLGQAMDLVGRGMAMLVAEARR